MNKEDIKEKEARNYVICKICGTKLDENLVFEHVEKTSHNEFKPFFNRNDAQELKGGV